MKSILRNIVLTTIGSIVKPKPQITILNGHYISRQHNPKNKDIFYQQLKQLQQFASFIRIEEAVNLINKHHQPKKPLVAFTFDDGFEDCYTEIAPILTDFNTNAAFFINPGYIEGDNDYIHHFNNNVVIAPGKKPMSYSQIKQLSDSGFIIGNHTYNHIRLSEHRFNTVEKEVLEAKKKIEEITLKPCEYFAWTYGQLNDIKPEQLEFLLHHHQYIFSGCNYRSYFSLNNNRILNRRHFEGNWKISHLRYFLSKQKQY